MDIIENQPPWLKQPPDGTKLYKIMRYQDFVNSMNDKYLYFHRVDQYHDIDDSNQPILEREKNKKIHFERHPEENYKLIIDRQRKRTYACCFSTKLTDYLWDTYSKNDPCAVCIEFNYTKMANYMFKIFQYSRICYIAGNKEKSFSNHQDGVNIFNLNFGLVEYIDPITYFNNNSQNAILYSYLKSKNLYSEDNEFRITLCTQGIFKDIILPNGVAFNFPYGIKLEFDFQLANAENTIVRLHFRIPPDKEFLTHLEKLLGKIHIS